MKRLGFVGAGNMGGAILRSVLDSGVMKQEEIMVSARTERTLDQLSQEFPQLETTLDDAALANECQMVLLAVKPQYLGEVLTEMRPYLAGKAVLSIAAGWTVAMLTKALAGTGATILRAMPNTPCLVGEGMTALCAETTFAEEDLAFARKLFEASGRVAVIPESQFDGFIAVAGSSPAYFYMLIEAMADGAVREGIPRKQAYVMAAQSMLGAAQMVLATGEHPGVLKDAVCSPAGTTIDAVAALERYGFRTAVMDAMHVCADKSRSMAK